MCTCTELSRGTQSNRERVMEGEKARRGDDAVVQYVQPTPTQQTRETLKKAAADLAVYYGLVRSGAGLAGVNIERVSLPPRGKRIDRALSFFFRGCGGCGAFHASLSSFLHPSILSYPILSYDITSDKRTLFPSFLPSLRRLFPSFRSNKATEGGGGGGGAAFLFLAGERKKGSGSEAVAWLTRRAELCLTWLDGLSSASLLFRYFFPLSLGSALASWYDSFLFFPSLFPLSSLSFFLSLLFCLFASPLPVPAYLPAARCLQRG